MESNSDFPALLLESDREDEDDKQINIIPEESIRFSLWNTFKHHIPRFLLTILIDVILPMIIYWIVHKNTRPVYALLAAGVPPFLMILIKATVSRTFDALGFVVLIGFVASAIVAVITRNPTIILLEKSIVTGLISLVFAFTLIPFRCCRIRPLAFYFYQDLVPTDRKDVGLPDWIFLRHETNDDDDDDLMLLSKKEEVNQVYEWIYKHCSSLRRSCYIITGFWSVGLLIEFLARLSFILLHFSIDKIFIYGHIVLILMTTLLILLTILFITRERKQTLLFINQWKKEHHLSITV